METRPWMKQWINEMGASTHWNINRHQVRSADTCYSLQGPPNTVLSERSQTRNDKHCVIPLKEVPQAVKSKETESRRVGARGWGTEKGRDCFMGTTWKDENVLEMMMVMFAQRECT